MPWVIFSLKSGLQTDQVLAIAYEYTYGGVTYQVGEFASDRTNINEALFVKSLKNTSNNPKQGNWDLMMKNVYYLASNIERDKFRLDVKYQSDTTGVYLSYIPEPQVKNQTSSNFSMLTDWIIITIHIPMVILITLRDILSATDVCSSLWLNLSVMDYGKH